MGFLDSLKSAFKSDAERKINNAATNAIRGAITGKGKNSKQCFTFNALPTTLSELQALPEASLDSAFKTVALVMATLCNYKNNPEETVKMLSFLKGPEEFNTAEQSFLKDRLVTQPYKPNSFFEGATPANGYAPAKPYKIYVYENPYSFDEDNWATMYVKSSGSDSERPIKLRKKPSTGQWFLNDIQCLADIKLATAEDKWA